ncbi:AMIN domain-containing protein, partial [Myxococcota bacterium]|nr:AMIN domain-containing protein [Myxococcota bacterium]
MATIGVVILAMGCASPQGPSGAGADGAVQTLGEVSVTRDGEGSIVFLDGLEDPVYSVAEQSDESLVVVDLVGVAQADPSGDEGEIDGVTRQVAAYDGVVDMVSLSTFEGENGVPTTRVEIQLSEAGRAAVEIGEGGLEVSVRPDSDQALIDEALGDAASASAAGSDEASEAMAELASPASADEAADEVADGVEEAADSAVTVVPVAAAAKTLTGLSAQAVEGGVLVGLQADGALGEVEVFALQNPTRLVVDIPGIQAAASVKNVTLESPIATRVRLGAHEGKLRIVVDGGAAAAEFAARQVMPGATGLWVALGEGEALTQAMTDALAQMESSFLASATAAASESAPMEIATAAQSAQAMAAPEASESMVEPEAPAASPAAPAMDVEVVEAEAAPASDAGETASTAVYGLSFERLEKMDRTAILADRPITFTTYEADATTLVVRIPNAKISDEASDRLFPEQGGPVSMIRAFQQPDVKVPEVRVVFTRAAKQKPVVSTHGSTLFVDFEDMGVAAAAPPAFPNGGEAKDSPASAGELTENLALDESGASVASSDALPSKDELSAEPQPTVEPVAMDEAEALFAEPTVMQGSVPAAVEVPAAIEVLEEGGLIDGKEYRGRGRPETDRRGLRPQHHRRRRGRRERDDPTGRRALGPGPRRDPDDEGARLRAGRQRPAHRAGRRAEGGGGGSTPGASEQGEARGSRGQAPAGQLRHGQGHRGARAAAALGSRRGEPGCPHEHADHQGHQLGHRRGDRADRGD